MRSFLSHADARTRESALLALITLCDARSAPHLAALVAGDEAGRALLGERAVDARTRLLALYGLSRIGNLEQEPAPGEAWRIVRGALERSQGDPVVEFACVQALGRQRHAEVAAEELERRLAYLFALLSESSRAPAVRARAGRSLARIHLLDEGRRDEWSERLLATLIANASAPDAAAPLRRQAILDLGSVGRDLSPQESARLESRLRGAALAESDRVAAGFALLSLASLASRRSGDERTGQALAEFVVERLDGPADLRHWAALACGRIGWELVRHTDFPSHLETMRSAVRACGALEPSPAYVIAAGLLVDERSLVRLTELLDHDSEALRRAARERASRQRFAGDPALFVDFTRACRALGDRELGARLLANLADSRSAAETCALLEALGATRSAVAVEPLLARLRDADQPLDVRVHAVRALGDLGDKEFLRWTVGFTLGLDFTSAPPAICDPVGRAGVLDGRD